MSEPGQARTSAVERLRQARNVRAPDRDAFALNGLLYRLVLGDPPGAARRTQSSAAARCARADRCLTRTAPHGRSGRDPRRRRRRTRPFGRSDGRAMRALREVLPAGPRRMVHDHACRLLRDHGVEIARVVRVDIDSVLYIDPAGRARTAWLHVHGTDLVVYDEAGFSANDPVAAATR